ncbi:MAG: ketohydroxyglutarate aldolase [Actinobacteria bacterium]|nr:ketohydroxyglutarate aldolase [Actinomycetota bacterium]
MTETRITVTVAEDHLDMVENLAAQLRAAGMSVHQVLSTVGIITGSVDSTARDSIGAVDGVAAVEEETSFQLPPPDAEVQ